MPGKENIVSKIIRNTKFNVLGYFWFFLVYLFLTPYIIGRIGIERFGIWAIISVITGYFGLLDLGFGTPFIKYIAEFYARREYAKINQVVNTGFAFYAFFAALIIASAVFSMHPIIRLFKIPAPLYAEAQAVFLIGVVIFAIVSVLKPFEAVQGGLQRMDITNKILIAVSIPNIAGTVFFLEKGYGLLGLIINSAIITGITSVVNIIVAFKILPELKFAPFSPNKETFGMLFGFGIKRWITAIEEIVLFQTDKLLISRFLNIGLVGIYQLGFSIISKAGALPMLLIPAIVPAASELEATRRKEDIISLYFKGTKYLLGFSIPVFTFLFSNAHLIMFIWMGLGYDKSALVIQLMAIAFLIMNFSAMGTAICVGIGRPEFQMKAAAGQAALNIALSIILILKIGFAGVLLATVISVLLSTAYLVRKINVHLEIRFAYFIRQVMFNKSLLVCFLLGITVIIGNCAISDYFSRSRIYALAVLIIELAVFLAAYFTLLLKIDYFDKEDIARFKDVLFFKKV
jgi:O-antigen/teichoic acid export membrane protein